MMSLKKGLYVLTALIILFMQPTSLKAQVIDTGDLERMEEGEFVLVPGQVQADLADTVSAEFVYQDLKKRGFEILKLTVEPVRVMINQKIKPETIQSIRNNMLVEYISVDKPVYDENFRERIKENETMSEEEKERIISGLEMMIEQTRMLIVFYDKVPENKARKLLQENDITKIEFFTAPPKQVIVKSEEGLEYKVMEALNAVDYVENTARVGKIAE